LAEFELLSISPSFSMRVTKRLPAGRGYPIADPPRAAAGEISGYYSMQLCEFAVLTLIGKVSTINSVEKVRLDCIATLIRRTKGQWYANLRPKPSVFA
jgi:hypothetical protein